MARQYYVYLLTNKSNQVLYIGVTNDLIRRIYEHKNKITGGFTSKYNVGKLIYFEVADSAESAINREKQLKAGPRRKKITLIESINPDWHDLYDEIATGQNGPRNDGAIN